MTLRNAFLIWHRWFGLLAALWLILLALTGSIIVFYDELDTLLNPDLRRASQSEGEHMPLDDLLAAAEASRPGSAATFADLANRPDETMLVFLSPPSGAAETDARDTYAFVDPYSGEVLGHRDFGVVSLGRRHIMDFIYELHLDLHLGGWMVWLLGLVSFAWLLDHIPAVALSFPSARKWARSFRIRRGVRGHKRTFDLHRAVGLWLAPVTFVLALSGVYFNWMGPFEHAVETVSPLTPRLTFAAPALPEPLYAPPVGPGRAVAIAEAHAGAEADILSIRADKGLYETRLFDPRDVDVYGRRLVTVDARSGELLDDRHQARGTAGDVFVAWQYPLHSGKAFGWPGRIVIFLSGLAVTAVSVTGVMIWARRAFARRGRRRRHPR